MEEKNYTIVDFREDLGLEADIAHSIRVAGKKAAMFTSRIKDAIVDNYKKAVTDIRNKAAALKNAAIDKATAMKEAVVEKAGEIKTGVVNATTHVMNSIDMHAYHLAQEDYQEIMKNKTAELDEKITNIRANMKAIQDAEIGFDRNQVVSEKERSYLLHRSNELIDKYNEEKGAIASETLQIATYKKGQNEKIKIAGKRRILIGALDLKRIASNAKGAVVNKVKKIAEVAGNTMSKMKEKMQERKNLKEEKLRQEQEAALLAEQEAAKSVAEEEAMKFQEELSSKPMEEIFDNLTDKEVDTVSEIVHLVEDKLFVSMNAFGEIMKINQKIDDLKVEDPKSYYIANRIAIENPLKKEINELGDNFVNNTDKIIKENPEDGLKLIKETNKKEKEEMKAKRDEKNAEKKIAYKAGLQDGRKETAINEEKINAEKQKAYEEGLQAGRKETANEIEQLKAELENLKRQVALITAPVKEEPTAVDYNSMKKDELLEEARKAGLDVKPSMKKADIINSLSKTELQNLKEQVETTKKK